MHKSCPLTTELVGPRNRHSRARTRPPSRAAQWAKGSIATRVDQLLEETGIGTQRSTCHLGQGVPHC